MRQLFKQSFGADPLVEHTLAKITKAHKVSADIGMGTLTRKIKKIVKRLGEEEYKAVLDWYVATYAVKGDYMPTFRTAAAHFDHQFWKIYKLYEVVKKGKRVFTTPDQQTIFKRLNRLSWKCKQQSLLFSISHSDDNDRKYLKQLAPYAKKEDATAKELALSKAYYIVRSMPTERWYTQLQRRFANWEVWDGDFKNFQIDINEKTYKNYLVNAMEYDLVSPELIEYVIGFISENNTNQKQDSE